MTSDLKNLFSQLPTLLVPGDFLGEMKHCHELDVEKITYKETYVALIDILGYKSLLDKHGNNAPSFIYNILMNAFSWIKSSKKSLKLFVFSDTLIIEGLDDNPINFWNIASALMSFQFQMLEKGILIRGGISYGKHFHENGILVSPAIVSAYKLEQRAIYPRIMIEEKTKIKAFQHITEIDGQKGIIYENYFVNINPDHISDDFDGEHILSLIPPNLELDYLKHNHHPDFNRLTPERIQHCVEAGNGKLKTIQEALQVSLNQCKDERVKQKLSYIKNKWNNYVSEFYHNDKLLTRYTID